MQLNTIASLMKDALRDWIKHDAPQLSAALAFYAVFSIAPIFIIAIALAGAFFGHEAAQGEVVGQIKGFLGESGARAVQDLVRGASEAEQLGLAAIVGIGFLLLGATGAFGQLKSSLDTIWEVPLERRAVMHGLIRDRILSFVMILVVGSMLIGLLAVSTTLAALENTIRDAGLAPHWLLRLLDVSISFIVVTLLAAAIFKILPDVVVRWRDVWRGAALTAVLFVAGNYAMSIYLARSALSSSYGAAGSMLVLLLWVYYSSLILFLGAEFTHVYALQYGSYAGVAGGGRMQRLHNMLQGT